jgi:hypothetical protein
MRLARRISMGPSLARRVSIGPSLARRVGMVDSARLVLQGPHFVLKHLLDAVLGDVDVADGDPELAGRWGAAKSFDRGEMEGFPVGGLGSGSAR